MTHPSGSCYRPTPKRGLSALVLVAFLGLALPFATTRAQGQPGGSYGSIAIGSSLQNTLANPQGQLTYHTYTVDISAGVGQLLIEIDGLGNDIDLAVRFGAEITSYQEPNADFDFADFSEEPNPSYVLDNPSPGVLYLDVINLVDRDATYTITVSGGGQPAAGNPLAPSQGDPFIGTFTGDGLTVTVRSEGGGYGGQLELGGQAFAFTAAVQGTALSGTFVSQGSSFPFSATLQGDTLLVDSGGTHYTTLRLAGVAPPRSTPAPQPAADSGSPLVGKWTAQQDFGFGVVTEQTLYFLPDGRYFYVESGDYVELGDFPIQEEGTFALNGDRLNFAPFCGTSATFTVTLSGEQITLLGEGVDPGSELNAFFFEPGSSTAVLDEIAAVDASREQENAL